MRYAIVVDCTRGFMSKNLKHQIEVMSFPLEPPCACAMFLTATACSHCISLHSQLVVVSPPGPRLPDKPLTFKLTEEQVRFALASHGTLLFYDVL